MQMRPNQLLRSVLIHRVQSAGDANEIRRDFAHECLVVKQISQPKLASRQLTSLGRLDQFRNRIHADISLEGNIALDQVLREVASGQPASSTTQSSNPVRSISTSKRSTCDSRLAQSVA